MSSLCALREQFIVKLYAKCRFVKHMLHRSGGNQRGYLLGISSGEVSSEKDYIYSYGLLAVFENPQMNRIDGQHKSTHYPFDENVLPYHYASA